MSDKVALVTGASRGIGKCIAQTLGANGFIVIGTATTDSGAEKISQYLDDAGVKGKGVMLNVCDLDAIKSAHKQICEAFSAPLVLVNNASINKDNLFLRMKPEQWDTVINTNLNSVYHVTKTCMKAMLKARWGRVISITSIVGVTGNPGQANYCAAKAGVIGFTKSIAQEMAGAGITANTIAPGFIETDMTAALTDKQRNIILSQIPMKKIGCVDDIAAAVSYLASEASSYMTGQTLHINGGMYMS